MQREHDISIFRELLEAATRAVESNYILLPVATNHNPEPLTQYRERVYAYELYHQLRCLWPAWPYSLCGEVDKSGHTIVRDGELDKAKPDLLVHVPGDMEGNLAVVEIKIADITAIPTERDNILRDLKKLTQFRRRAGYAAGLLLVLGPAIARVREHAASLTTGEYDLQLLELWHHGTAGDSARHVPWIMPVV